MLSRNGFINLYPIILLDVKPQIIVKPSWPNGLKRSFAYRGVQGLGSNPAGDIYFHFEFLRPTGSEQLNGAHANKIKHGHSRRVVIVVLDPRYGYSYKDCLYIKPQYSFKLAILAAFFLLILAGY